MTTKFPRTQALAVAEELVAALRPACERIRAFVKAGGKT